jgi:UDP-glucuronate 4-epimerase
MERILVTGAAGFIGFHISKRLLSEGYAVTGLDNLNSYYDVSLKKARLDLLREKKSFRFVKADLEDRNRVEGTFHEGTFDTVVHLAAQAGVRYSIENPHTYVSSNLVGFLNVLEGCRQAETHHLLFASTSSVYGANRKMPFSVHHNVDHPVSLYAATKKANELMAHVYSSLYGLPATGLRFFTVYGPWGRPDMAYFKFTKCIFAGKPIDVYNFGKMKRDFTYVDDIVEGIFRVMKNIPQKNSIWNGKKPDPGTSFAPYKLYNIGNNRAVALMEFIETLEEVIGKKAEKTLLPMQPGDVVETYANISEIQNDVGFRPKTAIREGLEQFVKWYRAYYNV